METSYYWNRTLIKLCETRDLEMGMSQMLLFFLRRKSTGFPREYVKVLVLLFGHITSLLQHTKSLCRSYALMCPITENSFCVYDCDGDGNLELIL